MSFISVAAIWLLLTLFAAHIAVDIQFQSDFVACNKNRMWQERQRAAGMITPVPWYYVMASHAACHALTVGWLMTNPIAAACEFVAHFIIDVLKCEGYTNIHIDQAAHVLCKIAWVVLL